MGRVLLAGFLGGIAMFFMMSIFHMSPIAQIGVSMMKDDAPVLSALQTGTANKPGFYIYPSVDMKSKDAMAKGAAARKVHPWGILVYSPPGETMNYGKLLATELAVEVAQSLIAAMLLSLTAIAVYGARVGFVVLVGLVSAITTNISYWNWYAFPASYTITNMGIELASFLAAGLVVAALVKPRTA